MTDNSDYFLYILAEDDSDEGFYSRCMEKITAKKFKVIPVRTRKNGGVSAVRKMLPIMLKKILYTGNVDNTFFLVAMDNDRRPTHPNHSRVVPLEKLSKREKTDNCRYCEVEKMAETILGEKKNWPITGAIAIPVQMMESWLLLICNAKKFSDELKLPIFSKENQPSTLHYHAPQKPGKQLKDLKEAEQQRLGIFSNRNFCIYCGDNLDKDTLASMSMSFRLFKDQVDGWF